MHHLDAKAVRERLNSITLAITSLENDVALPNRHAIARVAAEALQDIAALVTDDEAEQNGHPPSASTQRRRHQARANTQRFDAGPASRQRD